MPVQTFDDGSTLSTDSNGATTASNATDTAPVTSSPASALSGIADSVSSAVSSVSSAVTGAIGSVTGALSGLLGGGSAGQSNLPISNPLHNYASYTYIISLGALTADQFNFPLNSYLKGKLPKFIFKSAGIDPNNRINSPMGKNEFYLESLTIDGQMGFEKATSNTNVTSMEFTIVEPYSMGEFMLACQQAAYDAGYSNYASCSFLMMIEFYGASQTGAMSSVPNTKKFIPFKFNTMELKVTAAGSKYACRTFISNNDALTSEYNQLFSTAQLTGKTVQEMLQTGDNSLQTIYNFRLKQLAVAGAVKTPDEIVILFPSTSASSGSGQQISGAKQSATAPESSGTATTDTTKPINDPKLFAQLGVSRSTVTKTLVQSDGTTNAIGKSSMNFNDALDPRKPAMRTTNDVMDKNGNYIQSKVVAKSGYVDMKFLKGIQITEIINQVMMRSKYAVDSLAANPDIQGFKPWWRIDVQTFHITDNANDVLTGKPPKVIVYRVIPYKVHSSNFIAPGAQPIGIAQLKKQCVKVYDYAYSGKNIDILKFELNINQSWTQESVADAGVLTQANKIKESLSSESLSSKNKNANAPIAPTGAAINQNSQTATITNKLGSTSSDKKGGDSGENTQTRIIRQWHDALTNGYDMQNSNIEIVGDPYYIANSGMGNFTDESLTINLTKDGSINYQNSEVHILLNFRSPIDINQSTGLYNFGNTKVMTQFSGLFKIFKIHSQFRNGQFTQSLELNRIKGQENTVAPVSASLSDKTTSVATNIAQAQSSQSNSPGGGSAVDISAGLASGQLTPAQVRDAVLAQRAAQKG
jgi:hypothetical protein